MLHVFPCVSCISSISSPNMNVLGILLLCRLHKSCGSRDHRSPLQSLPLCWCHDWWHQFRGTPALMHQPHPSMCKMSAGSSSSMGIPSWSCLWHVTWQPGLWRNWREHNKRYLDFRVLPGVIVVPYFPNFFPLEYWLTDLCSAAQIWQLAPNPPWKWLYPSRYLLWVLDLPRSYFYILI